MKKILLVVSTAVFLMFGAAAFAETNIGVIDLNKVLIGSPQLAKAKADLKKKFDVREKAITKGQQDFQKAIEDFNKNGPTMKPDAQKKEQEKIMKMQKKLQEDQAKLQEDANAAQSNAVGDILKKIEGIVNKLAENKKLDLIVAKASLAYNKKELEVTDDVVKQLKQMNK